MAKKTSFVDEAVIYVKAGKGGNGCVAFRREKYVPRGGPSGGDGGKGGDVYIQGTRKFNTLLHFKKYPHHKAENGEHGKGKKQQGKKGKDCILLVPLGTLVYDMDRQILLGDIRQEGQRICVARGGRGGRGNARFATPTNQAPRIAEEGRLGEERTLKLTLEILAQVGLVGCPNVGKSTLLSTLTRAHPKVAPYPFTTLTPQLGILAYPDGRDITIAEIPGLIRGAHEGKGLGTRFLKHLARIALILLLVDLSQPQTMEEQVSAVLEEMKSYDPSFLTRSCCLVGTKKDLSNSESLQTLATLAQSLNLPYLSLSAVTGEGIKGLTDFLREKLS